MSDIACIVLAAGLGTRMKSALPKVLHKAGGRTLIGHVLTAARELGAHRASVVVGEAADGVAGEVAAHFPAATLAVQSPALGTGDAVRTALPALDGFDGTVLVLFGADPLMTVATLERVAQAVEAGADVAVLGFEAADPTGYGRLITDGDGRVLAIREHADASAEERRIGLCNSGVMAFRAATLKALLPRLGNANAKGEYYLTDLVGLANAAGATVSLATCPESEVQGVNTRAELAAVEAEFQRRYRAKAMAGGATLVAPETVFLSADTVIGSDVVIEPHVVIGPGVAIADRAVIRSFSHLERARVGEGAEIGPFARIRPGTELGAAARIGNFVEVKNARIEAGAKVNHLSYVGDARVGEKANVGAGTITCNYDGFFKHRTEIGAGAFIGSNSALVAPVTIGDGAYVGSGSVIVRDVEPGALAVARGVQEAKPGWAARYNKAQAARKAAGRK